MNYQKLEEITKGKTLPLTAENEDKERVVIEKIHNGDMKYYHNVYKVHLLFLIFLV